MPHDTLRVAVRPRGVLECLDLAVMVCGRRPLAIATAAVVGALPCVVLNRAVFANIDDQAMLAAWVVLGLETAWASIPLTLVLGQAVFSSRFSWRDAWRSFLGGLPAMIVFQGILRGLFLAIWVLAPVVFVGMYYLNQIILLERVPLSRVWRRLGAINHGHSFRILTFACIDALLLALGTGLGSRMLAAASRLWQDRGIPWQAIAAGDADVVAALFSWHGQIAFWMTCAFLTVFRFFTYLDSRIRREGWDVELRLRAEDTYAGLRHVGGRRRAPVTVVLMAAAALAASSGVCWGAERPAAPDATGLARQALARQSFPWYDAKTDRYRPLMPAARLDPAASSRPESRREPPPSRDPTLPALAAWSIMLGLLLAAVIGVVIVVVRHGIRLPPRAVEPPGADAAQTVASPDPALPAGLPLTSDDLLPRVAAAVAGGDFTAAMLHFHAWMLLELDRQGCLALDRGKTNGEYCAEVAATRPDVAGLFRSSSHLFERAFFGRLPIDEPAFRAVWEQRDLITAAAPPLATGR